MASELSDIEIIREMLQESAVIYPEQDKRGRKFSVALADPQEPKHKLMIYGLPEEAIVIKISKFTSPNGVFRGKRGECKRADFAIVAPGAGDGVIVCLEMTKSTKKTHKEVKQQLAGAECFVFYCKRIGEKFWNAKDFLKKYHHRFVFFGNIPLSKKPTRWKDEKERGNTSSDFLKIMGANEIPFSRLSGE